MDFSNEETDDIELYEYELDTTSTKIFDSVVEEVGRLTDAEVESLMLFYTNLERKKKQVEAFKSRISDIESTKSSIREKEDELDDVEERIGALDEIKEILQAGVGNIPQQKETLEQSKQMAQYVVSKFYNAPFYLELYYRYISDVDVLDTDIESPDIESYSSDDLTGVDEHLENSEYLDQWVRNMEDKDR